MWINAVRPPALFLRASVYGSLTKRMGCGAFIGLTRPVRACFHPWSVHSPDRLGSSAAMMSRMGFLSRSSFDGTRPTRMRRFGSKPSLPMMNKRGRPIGSCDLDALLLYKRRNANGGGDRMRLHAEVLATQFDALSQLTQQIPCYHLDYPRCFVTVAAARQALINHVTGERYPDELLSKNLVRIL